MLGGPAWLHSKFCSIITNGFISIANHIDEWRLFTEETKKIKKKFSGRASSSTEKLKNEKIMLENY